MKFFKRLFFVLQFVFFTPGVFSAPGAFDLLAPLDGAKSIFVTPAFSWQPSVPSGGDPTTYSIEYYINGAGWPGTSVGTGQLTSYNGTTFNPGDIVTWRVIATDGTPGSTQSASTWSFTIQLPDPNGLTIAPAAVGLYTLDLTPSFNWNDVLGADQYDVDIRTGGVSIAGYPIIGLPSSDYVVPVDLVSGTTYTYRARARNSGSSNTSMWVNSASFTPLTSPTSPVLIAPANGAYSVDLTSSFSWNPSANGGTITYRLQIDNNADFSSPERDIDPAVSPQAVAALLNNTQYFWRVIATNEAGSTNSLERSFTTKLPSAENLTINPAAAPTPDLTPSFDWDDVAGADEYVVDIKIGGVSIAGYPFTVVGGANSNYSVPLNLLPGTAYTFHVYPRNSGTTNTGSETVIPFTTLDVPTVPALTSPIDEAAGVAVDGPFQWTAANNGTITYELQIDEDGNFNPAPDISIPGIAGLSHLLAAPLDYNSTYYWRIRAQNEVGTGNFSSTFSFTTGFPPFGPPGRKYPVNASTGQALQPRFDWFSVTEGNRYVLELDDDPVFGSSVSYTIFAPRNYFDLPIVLNHNVTYYWRMKSIKADNTESGWTAVWSFKTTTGTISGLAYPVPSNPADGSIVYVSNPILSWYLSTTWPGISLYEIEYIAESSDFVNGAIAYTTSTSLTKEISGLEANTNYYWRIRAYSEIHDLYSAWSVISHFKTHASISGAPTQPMTLYPKDNVIVYHTDKPLLHWYVTAFNLDLTSNVEVDRIDNGPVYVNVFNGSTTTSQFWIESGVSLEPGKQYRWRVQTAKVGFANSAWSDYSTFTMDITTLGAPVKPIILYPKNDAVVYTGTPMLHWYVTYQIPGVEWNIRVTGPGYDETETSNSYQYYFEWPDELTAGESYTWQVQSKKGAATSDWSDPEDFVVYEYANGVPVKPTPIWPVGNATIYQNPPMLHWYVSTYVPGVEYEVSVVPEAGVFPANGTLTGSYQQYFQWTNTLVGGETYKWRVRSIVGINESAWSDEGLFTISATHAIGSLPRPVLVYPDGITVYVTKPILSWYVSTLTNVELFRVKVATNGAMTHHIAGSPFTTTTMSYAFENDLVPGTTYYWTVESSDGAGSYSTISNVGEFTINPESGAVVPKIGGPDGIFLSSTTANLNWYLPAPSTSELKYELEYSTSKDFSNSTKIDNVTGLKYTLENLQAGTEYYWRVRSAAGSEMSAYSFRGTFVPKNVTDVEEEAEVPEKFEVSQNYPNPFNPVTTISYSIPEASYVTIKIYNMLGQEVKTLLSSEVETGVHKIQWNGDNNSGYKVVSGTYIYRVTAGENAQSRKMILLK